MTVRIVSLAQQKGGVGKSSVAINLAARASRYGRALLVDLDSGQGTSSNWGQIRAENALWGPEVVTATASTLERLIRDTKREGGDAWVFLDLPGRDETIVNLAIKLSNFVLIPTRPLDIDLEAALPTIRACVRYETPYSLLMNICSAQTYKGPAKRMTGELGEQGVPVCPVHIVQRVLVPNSIAEGKAVFEVTSGNPSNHEFRKLFDWLKSELKG